MRTLSIGCANERPQSLGNFAFLKYKAMRSVYESPPLFLFFCMLFLSCIALRSTSTHPTPLPSFSKLWTSSATKNVIKEAYFLSNKLTWGQQQGPADGVAHQSCNKTFCIFKESFLFWQRHFYSYHMFLELGMRRSHFGTKRNWTKAKKIAIFHFAFN